MKLERSIVRRHTDRPELAEGERIQVELDPDQLRRMLTAGERLLGELNRLLGKPRPRRRRKR